MDQYTGRMSGLEAMAGPYAGDAGRLSPRERVMAAVNRAGPDRTPVDFWAEPPTWNRLLAETGAKDREQLLRALGVDVRHVNAVEPAERDLGGGRYQNFWGERYVYQPTPWGPMREDTLGALAGAECLDDLEAFAWPSVDALDHAPLAAQCRRHDRYAIVYGFADVWQRPALVRGWEQMFLDMAERPAWVDCLCRRFADFYIEDYTRAAEVTGGRIDLFLLISDLGSQHGPLISGEMFRRFVAPQIARLCRTIHGLGAKVLYHSCGDVRPFIDDLIGCGIDLLDPIQPVHEGMAPESLREAFGDRLSFHGGIDMQRILPAGTPGEVRAEAERYCRAFGPDGGYILSPAHLFQPDVPPANIGAMYAADRAPGA